MTNKMLLAIPGQFTFYKYGLNKEEQLQQEQNEVPMEIIMVQIAEKLKTSNIKRKRIYFLSAGTGAGKSSFFVVELLKKCGSKGMICTKPKQQLVLEPMKDLPPHYPEMIKGRNMGYKMGGRVELIPTMKNSVLFMTTQILSNMIIEEQWDEIFKYKFIAIDEVHEMNDAMIQVLYFIKLFIAKFAGHPECPVFICMSATINLPKFIKYFDMDDDLQWYDVGLLKSQQMKFERKLYYFNKSPNSLVERVEESFQFIDKFYIENKIWEKEYKDILIFCKNSMAIRMIQGHLEKRKFEYKVKIFQYMQIDNLKQNQNYTDFNQEYPGIIKIILSTNMLESGVNVPGLYTVVDTGIRFTTIYNNIQQKSIMSSIPIAQQALIQRMGRVGRNSDGMFIGLYSKDRQFAIDDVNPLLISPESFNFIFLYLKYQLQHIETLQDFIDQQPKIDIQNINLIEPLSADIINRGYHQFMRLGLIQRDRSINVSLFVLIKQAYPGFVRFICMYFGCDPFETAVIQYMKQRPFKVRAMSEEFQLEMIVKKDYQYFDIDEIVGMYEAIANNLITQKTYYEIPYNPEGYRMALWVLR